MIIYRSVKKTRPNDPECFDVNINTLKAIRLDPADVKRLREAASWSVTDLKAAQKALKCKRHGYISDRKRAAAETTIDIFKQITA